MEDDMGADERVSSPHDGELALDQELVPWWSFGKTLTAAAVLTMVRDGHARLDEPLPGAAYTLRQLLQHRAGLRDYGSWPAYANAVTEGREAWSVDELLTRSETEPGPCPPIGAWHYSNLGYLRLRKWLERTADDDFARIVAQRVLQPAGATDTRLVEHGTVRAAPVYDPRWVYPGLWVGPLDDARRVLRWALSGDALPAALGTAMQAAFAVGGPMPGRPWTVPGYGLGLMCGTMRVGERERRVAGHSGAGPGSVIAVYLDPDDGCCAAAWREGGDEGAVETAAFEALAAG